MGRFLRRNHAQQTQLRSRFNQQLTSSAKLTLQNIQPFQIKSFANRVIIFAYFAQNENFFRGAVCLDTFNV